MGEQKSGSKLESLWISFSIAAVWFSTHCGGGFATGNQEVNFYVKFGWLGSILMPVIAMVFVAWTYRNALVFAKDHNVHDYKSFANALFYPYDKFFSVVFEFCFTALILIAVSTSIAGAGSLCQKTLGVPYFAAIAGIAVVLLCLVIYGAEMIIRVLRYKAYFLIVTLIVLAYLGIKEGSFNIQRFVSTQETFGTSFGEGLWKALLYVGFQSFGMMTCVSLSHKITSTRECNYFGMFGLLLNGGFLVIMCVMLLGFAPEVLKETLPVYYATAKLGMPWLKIFYSVLLFVALIGTAISFVYTTVARFEKVWKGSGVFEHVMVRRGCIALVTILCCTGASTFGLTALVVKGYGSMGYVGLVLVVIPMLTFALRKKARSEVVPAQVALQPE